MIQVTPKNKLSSKTATIVLSIVAVLLVLFLSEILYINFLNDIADKKVYLSIVRLLMLGSIVILKFDHFRLEFSEFFRSKLTILLVLLILFVSYQANKDEIILYIILYNMIVALFEEYYFRGYLLGVLMEKIQSSNLIPVIISSLIFTGFHYAKLDFRFSIGSFLLRFTISMFLSYLVIRYRNLNNATLIHLLINVHDSLR